MAHPYGTPRRVSMSYILGFSKNPYKDAEQPAQRPKPSNLNDMLTTPLGIVEWTASDGRRGKLTGTGKQRLTAAALAEVPSGKHSVKGDVATKSEAKKAASAKVVSEPGDLCGLFGAEEEEKKQASKGDNTGTEVDKKNPLGWSEEYDKKLMDWKNEHGSGSWADCAGAVGKPQSECKQRFGQIKPADWRPPPAQGKDGGVAKGKQKQGKPDKNQTQAQKSGEGEKKMQESTGGDAANLWGPSGDDAWNTESKNKVDSGAAAGADQTWAGGGDSWANTNGNTNDSTGADAPAWDFTWPTTSEAVKTTGESKSASKNGGSVKAGSNHWKTTTGVDQTWDVNGSGDNSWDNTNGNTDGNTGGNKAASKSGSKAGSKSGGSVKAENNDWGNGNTDASGWGIDGTNEKTGDNVWEATGNDTTNARDGTSNPWDTINDQKDNSIGGTKPATAWDIPAPAKPASHSGGSKVASKAHSHRSSRHKSHSDSTQKQTELRPDDTFSVDDLRLLARILQQDAAMVWKRVSWRFRDKTGRIIDPDVFEKKITGKVEGKGSDRGEERM
ncbi:hypothetical protein ACN47E_009272 [Coniothyrium glycines]